MAAGAARQPETAGARTDRAGRLDGTVQAFASDGKTAMYVAVDGKAAGVVAVADTVRESARQAVRRSTPSASRR